MSVKIATHHILISLMINEPFKNIWIQNKHEFKKIMASRGYIELG